ncbi:MAG: GDSL-type esterase/lipase family protein [Sphingomonas paucimobilis]
MAATAVVVLIATYIFGYVTSYYRLKPSNQITNMIYRVDPYDPRSNTSWVALSEIYLGRGATDGIAFFGDSNVEYGDWPRLLGRNDILNHGIAGDTTRGLLLRLRNGEPRGARNMLLVGVNDMRSGITSSESIANIEKIVAILGPRNTVVISPILTGHAERNAPVVAIIESERALCRRLGCSFVDPNTVLSEGGALKPSLTMDGVHLTWGGYERLAPLISAALAVPQPR